MGRYTFFEQIVEFSCYLCSINFYTKFKLSNKIYRYFIILLSCITTAIVIQKGQLKEFSVPIWFVFQIASLFFVIKEPIKKRILCAAGSFFFVGLFNVILALIVDLFHKVEMDAYDYTWSLSFSVILVVGLIYRSLAYGLIHDHRKSAKRAFYGVQLFHLSFKMYSLLFSIAFIMAGLLMCNYLYRQYIDALMSDVTTVFTIFIVVLFTILVIVLLFIENTLKQYKEKIFWTSKYIKLQEKYYKSICLNNKKMRRFKHDINSHLYNIQELLHDKKYNEAENYLKDITKRFHKINSRIYYCDNYVVDAVLNQYVSIMQENDIKLDFKFDISNKDLLIPDVDFSILLSNLLQNAIDACLLVQEGEKNITLKIKEMEGNMFILISNTVNQDFTLDNIREGKTTKADEENHGIGLINIKGVVESYDGEMDFGYQHGILTIRIILFHAIPY